MNSDEALTIRSQVMLGLGRKMTVALVKSGDPKNKLVCRKQTHKVLAPPHLVFEKYGEGFSLGWQHAQLKSTGWRCHFLTQETGVDRRNQKCTENGATGC